MKSIDTINSRTNIGVPFLVICSVTLALAGCSPPDDSKLEKAEAEAAVAKAEAAAAKAELAKVQAQAEASAAKAELARTKADAQPATPKPESGNAQARSVAAAATRSAAESPNNATSETEQANDPEKERILAAADAAFFARWQQHQDDVAKMSYPSGWSTVMHYNLGFFAGYHNEPAPKALPNIDSSLTEARQGLVRLGWDDGEKYRKSSLNQK